MKYFHLTVYPAFTRRLPCILNVTRAKFNLDFVSFFKATLCVTHSGSHFCAEFNFSHLPWRFEKYIFKKDQQKNKPSQPVQRLWRNFAMKVFLSRAELRF